MAFVVIALLGLMTFDCRFLIEPQPVDCCAGGTPPNDSRRYSFTVFHLHANQIMQATMPNQPSNRTAAAIFVS